MSLLCTAARRKNPVLTEGEAARFLRQATMGVRKKADGFFETPDLVGTRPAAWIDTQLAYGSAQISSTLVDNVTPFVESIVNMTGGNTSGWNGSAKKTSPWGGFQDSVRLAVNHRMLYHPDRLRTKAMRCLLEYFSLGDTADGAESSSGGVYYDTLTECAFGTFQNLLKRVTMVSEMGDWLTYKGNRKASGASAPDENYAREIMQLYTIGLWELNLDGTRKRYQDLAVGDSRYRAPETAGSTDEVPTYGIPDIREMARVFTGLDALGRWGVMTFTSSHFVAELARMAANFNDHDFGEKSALYGWITIAASGTETPTRFVQSGATTAAEAERELDYVIRRLAEHPSTAPFFCKNMIEMMVTSNPSPEYVARVASVFVNDGTGQVGNLAAVFKAILLDQDARAPADRGKVARVSHFYDVGSTVANLLGPVPDTNGNQMAIFNNFTGSRTKIYFSGDINDGTGNSEKYGMKSMRSVFRRVPVRYSPVGPLQTAGVSAPEAFLLDEYGASLVYSMTTGSSTLASPATLAEAATADIAALPNAGAIAAALPPIINKWSILLTGDTAPQAYKDSLYTVLSNNTNFPVTNDTQRKALLTAMIEALLVGPYGMVRT
jgi:uncharacterized protein (DUF1800 family)